nr:MAG TPA_asm: hypothetical protein [Caudoviricetes sp.]
MNLIRKAHLPHPLLIGHHYIHQALPALHTIFVSSSYALGDMTSPSSTHVHLLILIVLYHIFYHKSRLYLYIIMNKLLIILLLTNS